MFYIFGEARSVFELLGLDKVKLCKTKNSNYLKNMIRIIDNIR